MPLTPEEKAELASLEAESASSGEVPQEATQGGNTLEALLQGFGNRASFGNLNKLQEGGEWLTNKVLGDPSAEGNAEAMKRLGPGAVISENRPGDYWGDRDKGLAEENPTAYGAGSLAGDIAAGVATGAGVGGLAGKVAGLGGKAAQVAANPLVRAGVEGAVSGAVDPNGSVVGGALGGAGMAGVGRLIGKGLKAAGGVARDVRQFRNSGDSLEKAREAYTGTKQGLWDLGAPEREAKLAALSQTPEVPNRWGHVPEQAPRSPDATQILGDELQMVDNAGRPVSVGQAPVPPKAIPALEAEKLARADIKDARKLTAPNHMLDPAVQIRNSKSAEAIAARGKGGLADIRGANPNVQLENNVLAQHAGLAEGLDEFNKDPLEKLLRAKRGSTDRGVLEQTQKLTGNKSMLDLANQLQRGKTYNADTLADALASPAKSAVRLGSQASDAAGNAVSELPDSLRNILLQLSRDKGAGGGKP